MRDSGSDILNARLVCSQWNQFASEILKKKVDNHLESTFTFNTSQPGRTLWLSKETRWDLVAPRFTTWEQISEALRFEESNIDLAFTSEIVILAPYYGLEPHGLKKLLKKYDHHVKMFLDRFKNKITTLVCFFHWKNNKKVPVHMLRKHILKLPILQNLFIYLNYGKLEPNLDLLSRFRRKIEAAAGSSKIKSLHIGEDTCGQIPKRRLKAFLPPILLFAQNKELMTSLTNLEFEWPRYERIWDKRERSPGRGIMPKLEKKLGQDFFYAPNLQTIKITFPDERIFSYFSRTGSVMKLKEVSFIFNVSEFIPKTIDLGALVRLLDFHSQTLTSFSLEVSDNYWKLFLKTHRTEGDSMNWTGLDLNIKYPNMRKLGIHLISVMNYRWNETIKDLLKKCPNLEQVFIIGDHYETLNGIGKKGEIAMVVMKQEMRAMVRRLWKILPASVTTIGFPNYVGGLEVKRGENLELNRMILPLKQN